MLAESVESGPEQLAAASNIFDAVDVVLYVADIETHELLFLNAYGEKIFGSGHIGERCYDVLQAGQGGPCAFCTNPRLVKAGKAGPPVVWDFQNSVSGRWFLCIDKAIRWHDGRLVRMEVAIDITDRKARERFHEQYVGLISHDLRSPLSAIEGSAATLKFLLEGVDLPQGTRRVDAILRGTRRMSEMIEDLLETTLLESGGIELHVTDLDLTKLVASVIASFTTSASRLIGLTALGSVRVMADAGRLERVLDNLIGNAIRYSSAESPLEVRVASHDDEVVVTVADRGVGIPPSELPRLFERHYRGTHDRGSSKGLGLGLYTSRLIIESHHGRIWADSEVGAGSTFGFALPIKRTVDRATM
ncbi:MAG: sensor histidine kinase [Burkholderiaceae bacterium]